MKPNQIIAICILLFISKDVGAQTPGQVFVSPTGTGAVAILDPNSNGFISVSGLGYSSDVLTNLTDESQESEIPYISLYHPATEPTGDTQTGGSCNATELIDNPLHPKNCAFYYFMNPDNSATVNGDEKLLLRMRLAKTAAGNYGYSFLIDTDNKIGSGIDPNFISGNPGFEVEVLYGSGASGVRVINCDGSTSGTVLAQYPNVERVQKSYVRNTNCSYSDQPYFLDYYIDYSTISTLLGASSLRIAWATSSSPNSALGGSASDIGGFGTITNDDDAFITVVNGINTEFNFVEGGAMPLTLNNFNYECTNNTLDLKWQTASEWNTDYFSVEHSIDMKKWTSLGGKPAAGNSSEILNYDLNISLDKSITSGYIRLSEIDKDGKVYYFNTQPLSCARFEPIVYPNPVESILTIDVPTNIRSLSIRQMDGVEVFQQDYEQSYEAIKVDVKELTSGIYTVYLVTSTKELLTSKFIKL